MNTRAMLAAALLGLAVPALRAADFASPTFNQAAKLAGGRASAEAAYDGNASRGTIKAQVDGALTTGGLTTPTSQAGYYLGHEGLRAASVPKPGKEFGVREDFFSGRSLLFGAGGAAAGAGVGWLLGGLLGAAIGAGAGFLIGFALSKHLRA